MGLQAERGGVRGPLALPTGALEFDLQSASFFAEGAFLRDARSVRLRPRARRRGRHQRHPLRSSIPERQSFVLPPRAVGARLLATAGPIPGDVVLAGRLVEASQLAALRRGFRVAAYLSGWAPGQVVECRSLRAHGAWTLRAAAKVTAARHGSSLLTAFDVAPIWA